jgi:hypothetical protein
MAVLGAAAAAGVSAQSNAPGARYRAVAMDLEAGAATPLEIVVERWSSDAQHNRLMAVLMEKGAEKLLDALEDAPSVGYIRANQNPRWHLRYARRTPGPDGGEGVMVITDRPIALWEAFSGSRSIDYPFTLIELRLKSNGEGDGTLSIATKIIPDKRFNIIVMEHYGEQRIRLVQVKKEPLKQ